MNPAFLRQLSSNDFHKLLADPDIRQTLAYKLGIFNYQEDQEER